MTTNPFSKSTFETIWLFHFKSATKPISFKSINFIKFYKAKRFPLYVNVGKNVTNGMDYQIDKNETDYKGKTFLIHDVPTYYSTKRVLGQCSLKIKKVKQYKGFLADLSNFESSDHFLKKHFRSKSRHGFNRKHKLLSSCFNIKSSVHYGHILKSDYDKLMVRFRDLISKRFNKLGKASNVLSAWDYYEELIYSMLLKKQALISAVYRDNVLISGALCFLSKDILYYAVTTFDTDYFNFSLGDETIINLYEWCFKNDVKILDFSKGAFHYKKRWATTEYDFETHIIYDSNSFKSIIIAFLTSNFYRFKQFLRDRKVNLLYSKVKFCFSKNRKKSKEEKIIKVDEFVENIDNNLHKKIDLSTEEISLLRPSVFKSLFKNTELANNIEVFKNPVENNNNIYYVVGEKTKLKITVK